MLLSLKYVIKFLYISGVTLFILMTLFDRLFVVYCSSSAMFHIRLIISPYLITPCMKIGEGLWFRDGLGFPSAELRFLSFVSSP